MSEGEYDALRDDIDVTDQMEAKLDATCVSITANGAAADARYAERVAHEGKNKVPPIALARLSGTSEMWKATIAGLAVKLGEVTDNRSYGFEETADLIGAGRSPPLPNERTHDGYTRGEVVRRWAEACERGERTIATSIYERACKGDTLRRGHVPDGGVCKVERCSICLKLDKYQARERPTIDAILTYGMDRNSYIRKTRKTRKTRR